MKPKKIAALAGLGVFLFAGILAAQDDPPPVPHAPYLAAVPDYGHWTVTFNYQASAPSSPATSSAPAGAASSTGPSVPDGSPTSIDTIKTGDLRGIVLTFADGTSKQFTCQGDWVLSSTAKGPQLGIANPTARPYMYYTRGFILLDGVKVNSSTFVGVDKRNGEPAFHYKSREVDVWIDPNSMLPLAVKQPGVEADYQFLNPPPRPFPIPKDQASLLKKEQDAYQSSRSLR